MIASLQQILEGAFERLRLLVMAWLPPLIAAAIILACALALAALVRWLILRLVKAPAMDRFLGQTGLSGIMSRSWRLRATRVVASTAWWAIVLGGALTALGALGTAPTSQLAGSIFLLLPKAVAAGAIVVAGIWVGRYLGRSALIWACNEGVPHARVLSSVVRVLITCVAIAAAAEHLRFAPAVFLAVLLLVAGGVVLAASIAVGTGSQRAVARLIDKSEESADAEEKSLWNHL
jgi:hypothetical protein